MYIYINIIHTPTMVSGNDIIKFADNINNNRFMNANKKPKKKKKKMYIERVKGQNKVPDFIALKLWRIAAIHI